jgi:hypothetical protein
VLQHVVNHLVVTTLGVRLRGVVLRVRVVVRKDVVAICRVFVLDALDLLSRLSTFVVPAHVFCYCMFPISHWFPFVDNS